MRKHFLIDTSIILDNPDNLYLLAKEGENSLYITDAILEELDRKKTERANVGFFARAFFRIFIGSVAKAGVKFKGGIIEGDYFYEFACDRGGDKGGLKLIVIHRERYETQSDRNDLKILEIAKSYGLRLITNDISLKIIALTRGVKTESFYEDTVSDYKSLEFFHKDGANSLNASKTKWAQYETSDEDGRPHFYIDLGGRKEELYFDKLYESSALVVAPHNLEQKFMLGILTHPQNKATAVSGSTGSGKTLMALQAGLMLCEREIVDGIVYLRNTVEAVSSVERLGYRAGDEERKLSYFMYPLFSAINLIIEELRKKSIKNAIEYSGDVNTMESKAATKRFMEKNNIEMVDLAHARGVTISRKFVIFDEAQNASTADIKLLGTRLGKGSRIVFLGDLEQVDNPYLTQDRNGLVTLLKKAHISDFVAGIQLRNTIRSDISRWFGQNL
ncbi:MAG: PhoH family protein [Helicobacteraceae bacterium]|nr:PhoH family protein [Helicobacteraceae bacterium]